MSENIEPYKEPRETTSAQGIPMSYTGQQHQLRPRSTARVSLNNRLRNTKPLTSEDSDDDLNPNTVRKRVRSEDSKPAQVNKPVGWKKQQGVSEIPTPDVNSGYTAHQFRYLVNTRHFDDEGGGEWETMRVVLEGDNRQRHETRSQ